MKNTEIVNRAHKVTKRFIEELKKDGSKNYFYSESDMKCHLYSLLEDEFINDNIYIFTEFPLKK